MSRRESGIDCEALKKSLKELVANGMSRFQVAQKSGVHRSTISNIESGKVRTCNIHTWDQIYKAFPGQVAECPKEIRDFYNTFKDKNIGSLIKEHLDKINNAGLTYIVIAEQRLRDIVLEIYEKELKRLNEIRGEIFTTKQKLSGNKKPVKRS